MYKCPLKQLGTLSYLSKQNDYKPKYVARY